MHQTRDDMEAFANADMARNSISALPTPPTTPSFAAAILEPVRNSSSGTTVTSQRQRSKRATCDLHERILKAIADGDAQEAQQQMREHFAFAREHYFENGRPAQAGRSRRVTRLELNRNQRRYSRRSWYMQLRPHPDSG